MSYETLDAFFEDLPRLAAGAEDKLKGHNGLFAMNTKQGRQMLFRLEDGVITLPETADRAPDCEVTADERIGGGIRVATPDGRLFYDNTFAARLKRLRERFRAELAETVPPEVLNPPLGKDAESRGTNES